MQLNKAKFLCFSLWSWVYESATTHVLKQLRSLRVSMESFDLNHWSKNTTGKVLNFVPNSDFYLAYFQTLNEFLNNLEWPNLLVFSRTLKTEFKSLGPFSKNNPCSRQGNCESQEREMSFIGLSKKKQGRGIYHFLGGPSQASLFLLLMQLTVNKIYWNWIWIADFWCRKLPLLQLSNSHCPW